MEIDLELCPTAWSEALAAFPPAYRDVYFTPEYHGLHAVNGDGDPFCTMIREGNEALLVPGLRVPVPGYSGCMAGGSWDLQTCNGYGGPLASPSVDSTFLERAWAIWRSQLASGGCVAAFFRLHPLLENEGWLPGDARVIADRQTVFLSLTEGVEQVWKGADGRHRNMVSKGPDKGFAPSGTNRRTGRISPSCMPRRWTG